ncbi:HU family DNA-binding protein [bacterium]|nr:HU family DNA-binding protein [bacterium]
MAKRVHKPLTKAQLISHLAETCEIPKKSVAMLMEELIGVAYKEAKKEKGFTLPGVGKLVVVKRKARMGRNPATGEAIKIPARKALKFRISKAAKDAVLG